MGMTVQVGRKELSISIAAEGNDGGFSGSLRIARKLENPQEAGRRGLFKGQTLIMPLR